MKKMSKNLYIGFYTLSLVLFVIGVVPVAAGSVLLGGKFAPNIALPLLLLAILGYGQFIAAHFILTLLILSKMWGPIQDGRTPVTVGQAIGYSFIPFFNIYWIFRAWGSFPAEYNNFVGRYRLPVPALSGNVFRFYPVLMLACVLVVPVLLLPFVFMAVISQTSSAFNNLTDALQQRRNPPRQPVRMSVQPNMNVQPKMMTPPSFLKV
jgi:hypothetical protein